MRKLFTVSMLLGVITTSPTLADDCKAHVAPENATALSKDDLLAKVVGRKISGNNYEMEFRADGTVYSSRAGEGTWIICGTLISTRFSSYSADRQITLDGDTLNWHWQNGKKKSHARLK